MSVVDLDRTELAVLVAGGASMSLEILAGRLVAPEFGSSIYTWGSIIGVFLTALSMGYHVGGARARQRASHGALATVLLQAAVFVALLAVGGEFVLAVGDAVPVSGRFASLIPVALLFGPPTFLLGFASPYAAELSRRDGTGAASGRVYAVGTVGSIAGTFLATFVLVPTLGVPATELVVGLVLVAGAVATARGSSGPTALKVGLVVLLLVAATGANAAGVAPTPASVGGTVVYETQTPYQHLEVRERGSIRTLYLDGQPHSAMDTTDPTRHVFEYTRYFHLPYLFADDPDEIDRVLFVGGGGFSGPRRFLAEYDVTVDVVEIDPEVVRVATEYFGVEESDRLRIHVGDGREFLEETNHEYDLIVLDAYRKDQVPFHLATREFFSLAASRLDEDGMVVANVISAPSGGGSAFFRAEYRTLSTVFPQVYAFRTVEASVVQNVEVVATKRERRLSPATLRVRNERRSVGVDLSGAIELQVDSVRTGDVPTLTDEYAPVDRLLDPMLGRRYVLQETGTEAVGTNASAGGGDGTPLGNESRTRLPIARERDHPVQRSVSSAWRMSP